MKVNTRDLGFINYNNQEMNWVKINNVVVYETWQILTKSGMPPLSLKSKGSNLINYKMYGNSLQDGIPTPSNPIEIVSVGTQTKNLYNHKEFPLTKGTYIVYKTGFAIEVTSTSNYSATLDFVPIEPNTTYTLNYTSGGNNPGIAFYREANEKSYISGVKSGVGFTTPDEARFMRFSVNKAVDETTVQLEEGGEITSFEPYGYEIPVKVSNNTEEIITNILLDEPLRKIGDYADYIDFGNQKVVRNIEKEACEGLTWTQHQTYKNIYSVNSARFKKGTGLNAISESFDSTKYLPAVSIRDMTVDYCIKTHATSSAIYISDSVHTTLDDFEEFVKGKFIYYILNTQAEETIELPSIGMVKGSVVLETDTRLQPSNMEVTYEGKL